MAILVLSNLDLNNQAKITNLVDGTSAQDAVTVAQLNSAVEGLAWKDSVRAASTANINLSSPGTTIDGITMATNDRFLAKDQSTGSQNGIYIFNGSATPATRSLDASTSNELEGAVVVVEEGTTNSGTTWRQTSVNFTIDSGAVAWTTFGTAAGAASETSAGVAELATQSETNTGTDDARIVTPLKLKNWSNAPKKFQQDIGDGSATSYNVTHNLGTRDVIVQVRKTSGNFDSVMVEVQRPTDTNTVTVVFASAPASNAYRVIVLG